MPMRWSPPGGDRSVWATLLWIGGALLIGYGAWKGRPLSLALGTLWLVAGGGVWFLRAWARWVTLTALVCLGVGLVWLNHGRGWGWWLFGLVLLGKGIWDAWRTLRPEGAEAAGEERMSREEAQRRAEDNSRKYNVRIGEPQEVNKEDLLRILEKEKQDEAAALGGAKGYRLTITMLAPIQPIERGERFEEPLREALGNLGVVHGGGSLTKEIDGAMVITEVDIGVSVKDLERGLAIIRKCLKAQGAPKGTTIKQTQPTEGLYPLDE